MNATKTAVNHNAALIDADVLPDDDDEDEEFSIVGGNLPALPPVGNWTCHAGEMTCNRTKPLWTAVRGRVAAITPERDGKLHEIKQDIRNRVKNPTTDRNNNPNRKLLVFTTFKDTAEYLYQNMTGLAAENLG